MDNDAKIQPTAFVPMIVESSPKGERGYDIFSRLLMDRIVLLGTEVNDQVANVIIGQLLYLDMVDPDKEVRMYINSPGGSIYAGLAIIDTMQCMAAPVSTLCQGMAASMGAWILAAGEKGHRHMLPHARVMIHQPSSGARGQASDIEIQANEVLYLKRQMNQMMAGFTGQSPEKIHADCDRDTFMSAEEAVAYGLVDDIIKPHQRAATSKDR